MRFLLIILFALSAIYGADVVSVSGNSVQYKSRSYILSNEELEELIQGNLKFLGPKGIPYLQTPMSGNRIRISFSPNSITGKNLLKNEYEQTYIHPPALIWPPIENNTRIEEIK